MFYRSVTVPTFLVRNHPEKGLSPESKFLTILHTELQGFGRKDVKRLVEDDTTTFIWSTRYDQCAGPGIREKVAKARLLEHAESLHQFEQSRPEIFNAVFDVSNHQAVPRVIATTSPEDEALFDYWSKQQSIEANVIKFRSSRFLVYDDGVDCAPLMGIIGISTPVYFNGARDKYLGWEAIGVRAGGNWNENSGGKGKRDKGLLHIAHIGICSLVPPYTKMRMQRLLASLCFSQNIIATHESRYNMKICGLSTTGGWGSNACAYQRIPLGKNGAGGPRELFRVIEPKKPSLNRTRDYFTDALFDAALEIHRLRSNEPTKPLTLYRQDESLKSKLLDWTLKYLRLPSDAVYINKIGHYFGTVTDEAVTFLSDCRGKIPPSNRTIALEDILNSYRSRHSNEVHKNVSPARLSDGVVQMRTESS